MIKKKVCMLGTFAVGKTSLVRRFVQGLFSDKYLTTVGVKIDKKVVTVSEEQVQMVLWDIAGENGFQRLEAAYLRGMSAYFLVVDGTRSRTLDDALTIQERIKATNGEIPFMVLLNKSDLNDQWELDDDRLTELENTGHRLMRTSAKSGAGVEEAFSTLAEMMLERVK
ncbi:MAG: GTP-binding protein [Candidatus Coatesbacteria bacterium]|nr:GTP-binding protein [Candidatus Coatesbacteria bacterium]